MPFQTPVTRRNPFNIRDKSTAHSGEATYNVPPRASVTPGPATVRKMKLPKENSPIPMDFDCEETELQLAKVGANPRDQHQREQLPIKPTRVDEGFVEILSKEGSGEPSDDGRAPFDDNAQILPVPARVSFSSIHQDFLLLVRQVGEMHVQAEEHILEMQATLSAAFAETLHDQGNLEGLLDRLYELDADMEGQIVIYEDFVCPEHEKEF
jgi:hypothetical protein